MERIVGISSEKGTIPTATMVVNKTGHQMNEYQVGSG